MYIKFTELVSDIHQTYQGSKNTPELMVFSEAAPAQIKILSDNTI